MDSALSRYVLTLASQQLDQARVEFGEILRPETEVITGDEIVSWRKEENMED